MQMSDDTFISLGATSWVFKVHNAVAVKYVVNNRHNAFARENRFYDVLERNKRCPFIMESFLRQPGINFLPLMAGGSLDDRMKKNQLLDESRKLISVVRKEPLNLVERWIAELSSAVSWLEKLGYVHGDLRPNNILLDGRDHLKLADFDCVEEIGTVWQTYGTPWSREITMEEALAGPKMGPRTEQFAIGSILYTMTRGHEPYEDTDIDGPDVVDLFIARNFPKLGDGRLDNVIHRCWHGDYASIKQLADDVSSLPGAKSIARATVVNAKRKQRLRRTCRRLLVEGQLEFLSRLPKMFEEDSSSTPEKGGIYVKIV